MRRNPMLPAAIFFNVIIIFMIISSLSLGRMGKLVGKYGSEWDEVDVVINDKSFSYDGESTDSDGNTTYQYKLERMLDYDYNGQHYSVLDTKTITKTDRHYEYELQTDYTDKYTYQVNPEKPTMVKQSYNALGLTSNYSSIFQWMFTGGLVVILVIMDLFFFFRFRPRKRDVFEDEINS